MIITRNFIAQILIHRYNINVAIDYMLIDNCETTIFIRCITSFAIDYYILII